MRIYITVETDVTEKVFEELKELHEKPELVVGTEEQYNQATETVESIVNIYHPMIKRNIKSPIL